MCVNNLPEVVTWKQNGRDSNQQRLESQVQHSNYVTSRPESNSGSMGLLVVVG